MAKNELILMEKNGEKIRVNPAMVDAHLALGWWVVKDAPVEAPQDLKETPADAQAKPGPTTNTASKPKTTTKKG